MKKYLPTGLYVVCLLAWVGVAAGIAWNLDRPGAWYWMLVVGGAVLLSLVILLVWAFRLVRCLYRWHPAVRELLLGLLSVLLMIWGYRGFERVTWYELHLADCTGVRTSPTWHVSPLQKVYLTATDDWSVGRFGLRLVANMIEYHCNYHPIVGHGSCRVEYSVCEHIHTRPVFDSFTLELPEDAESGLRLQMSADSTALGLIIVSSPRQADSWYGSNQPPQQWAAAHGHPWIPLTPGVPIDMPGFKGNVHFYIAYRPGPSSDAPANSSPYDIVHFAVRLVE